MVRWVDPRPVDVPETVRKAVAKAGKHDTLVGELLVRRGIADGGTAHRYLDPAAYTPAPPESLPHLTLAVDRLERAIQRGERIVVWGDFDVDGQTATALYLQALRSLGAQVTFHLPSRRESHGVHTVGVQRLVDGGAGLLLTADTGVAAHHAVDLAEAQGVDVLITDHHDLGKTLPNALAVVNPRCLSPEHPLYELPGVGVAYQVIRSLYGRAGRADVDRLLDLVALGIVADVATLRADVRYLLQLGLHILRRADRLGLRAVYDLAELDPSSLSAEDIGYRLAPRLNALCRVGSELDTRSGVELLLTDDLTRARTIATSLEALNARRRWLTRQTTDAALAQLDRDRTLLSGPAIVVASPTWDPGIVGIVAGRLAERFNKPAIVLSSPDGEMARGSARSIEGVDIHAAIAAQRQLLYRCGGHPMAAGLSLDGARIPEFQRALWRTMERTVALPAEREIKIDADLSLDQLSVDLVEAVDLLAPFGAGNERPVFAAKGLELANSTVIGRTREHRRLVVRDGQGCERTVMWWQGADQPQPEGRFDLAYTLGVNAFRGGTSVQLTWVDGRLLAPPVARVVPVRRAQVLDHRNQDAPLSVLRALCRDLIDGAGTPLVWAEAADPIDGIAFCDRTALHVAETLIIWTIPPSPIELQEALEQVSSERVVLFALDPEVDELEAFLRRLGGLVNYALRRRGGEVQLSTLAARMAHTESTVGLGLEWMVKKGQIEITSKSGDVMTLSATRGRAGDSVLAVQGQLEAQLEEAAAYRSYFCHAQADRLVER